MHVKTNTNDLTGASDVVRNTTVSCIYNTSHPILNVYVYCWRKLTQILYQYVSSIGIWARVCRVTRERNAFEGVVIAACEAVQFLG